MQPTSHRTAATDPPARTSDGSGGRGIVVLATLFNAPIAGAAIRCAVDAAGEHDLALALVNVVDISVGGRGPRIDLGEPADVATSLRHAAEAAASPGVPMASHRIRSLHPVATLVALIRDAKPALVVYGPDTTRLSALRHMTARRYRQTARALARQTSVLLWSPMADAPRTSTAGRRSKVPALVASWPTRRQQLW